MTHNNRRLGGNFDTGEVKIEFDGEIVFHQYFVECNQHHAEFKKRMLSEIHKGFDRAYNAGKEKAKADLLEAINKLSSNTEEK